MNVQLLKENAKLPTRGSDEAAGLDLYSTESYAIKPGEVAKVSTGIAIELPINTFGGIYPRSGLATKRGLRLCNCVGVVDSDYRGEVIVPIYNDSNCTQMIEAGERVAQLIVQPYMTVDIVESHELSDTKRGAGGFGSSGTN